MHFNTRAAIRKWNFLANSIGYLDNEQMFTDLYVIKGMSTEEISKKLGYCRETITTRLKFLGIKIRPRGGPNCSGKTWTWKKYQ